MNPVKIVAGLLVLASVAAALQTINAPRAGKRLALGSIRNALEERVRTDRDRLVRDAVASKSRLLKTTDLDVTFRDVVTVWLAREPSPDLSRPTVEEIKALPTAEALLAIKRLTPDTGFEGARIRSLYEARNKTPREQQGVLARLVSANPADSDAVRAYVAALRIGEPEERRKAIEIGREYVRTSEGSALSRLTLLLAERESNRRQPDAGVRAEAKALADGLLREVPETSFAHEWIRGMAAELGRSERGRVPSRP